VRVCVLMCERERQRERERERREERERERARARARARDTEGKSFLNVEFGVNERGHRHIS
jgi:hypothetical protein